MGSWTRRMSCGLRRRWRTGSWTRSTPCGPEETAARGLSETKRHRMDLAARMRGAAWGGLEEQARHGGAAAWWLLPLRGRGKEQLGFRELG
jgi:hypothetical protein